MPVELRDLRAFLAVAEERSFARAAERLNVAQPALSRRIARMEAELGFPLLARTTRRVEPTPAGTVFAAKARGVLEEMDLAIDAATRTAQGRMGEVCIGYNDFAIGGPLPDVIQAFRAEHDRIWVQLKRAGTEEQLRLLRRGRVDVCFLIGPIVADGLNRHTVWRDRYCAVAAENDPLVAGPDVALADLAARPHVLGDRAGWQAYRERVRRLYTRAEAFPEIVAEGPDTSVVLGLVASGVGVTVYPACIENVFRRGVAFRPIRDVDATLDTLMVWDPDRISPAATTFVEAAIGHCARWPDGRYDTNVRAMPRVMTL
ncbi:LysR family transcriptional regulator [Jannaschia sp. LMIT008]|uniref:LysR family transcriptional regulator n=1 Tax=Jannaschia maritima TaxID=3032585 RepID=UPI002810AE21|nr:LysR family transcriptional regulator [Jannaschia sp. LMIT008]